MNNQGKIPSEFHKESMTRTRCVTLVVEPVERGHDIMYVGLRLKQNLEGAN
jgi:hypothetical protein